MVAEHRESALPTGLKGSHVRFATVCHERLLVALLVERLVKVSLANDLSAKVRAKGISREPARALASTYRFLSSPINTFKLAGTAYSSVGAG